MVEPLWYKRLNYETNWMTRKELQDITYEAIARLVEIKAGLGLLPLSTTKAILSTIDETRSLLKEMERSLELDGNLSSELKETIKSYNRKILSYSSDQIIPRQRPFGGRWFDDYTVPAGLINNCRTIN